MKKSQKAKVLAKNYQVPQSKDEADEMIKELGETRRHVARIQADMNDQLASIKEEFEKDAEPFKERGKELMSGLEDWCSANRQELTKGKVKFIQFKNGEVKWRLRPPRVALRGVDAIIDNLRGLGLERFIRTKEEVNKDALLNEPDVAKGVAGVTIGTEGEDFIVEPFEDEISGAAA